MKRIAVFGAVAAMAGLAFGQTVSTNTVGSGTRLTGVQLQLGETVDALALRQAMAVANQAYEQAVTALPQVAALDAQLAAARQQVRDLTRQRASLVQTNAPALQSLQAARDAAAAQYYQAHQYNMATLRAQVQQAQSHASVSNAMMRRQ